MTQELIIGVSGINAVDNPGPGVGVARSLREDPDLKVKIVGLAYDALEPGIYLNWLVDKSYVMPYPASGGEALIERLAYIKKNYGLDAIIPNLDVELPFYAQYAKEIAGLGIKTFLPTLDQFKLRAKDRLDTVAEKMKVRVPKTRMVNSYEELTQAMDELGVPVMVKGAFYKAFRAFTYQEAAAFYNQIVAEWGYPVLVQEIVAGEEMNLIGVGDGQGGSLGQVGIKKMWVTSLGKIWVGVTIKNELLMQAAQHFLSQFQWKGAFELECIVQDETIYLIEINPRFPAWSYFATGVGINLPASLVRTMLGLPLVPAKDYAAGKMFVRYTYEVITDMQTFQAMNTKGES